MNLRSTTAAATMVIGAMAIGLGTAHAEPAPVAPQPISYSVKLVDKTVVATLKGGTFELAKEEPSEAEPIAGVADNEAEPVADVANIKDKDGNLVMVMPLKFTAGGVEIPVKPVVKEDGRALELATERPADIPAGLQANTVGLKSIASPEEDQKAMNNFGTQFGIATAVGGFVGTAVGVVAGGIIGCILGLPLLGVGCIPAAIAGAGIGGILGTLAVGGPVLTLAGMDLLNTLQAAPGTSKFAENAPK